MLYARREKFDFTARLMARRPLCLAVICYFTGCALGYYASVPAPVWGAMALCAAAICLTVRKPLALMCALMLAGAALTAFCAIPGETRIAEGARFSGLVTEFSPFDGDKCVATLDDVQMDGEAYAHRLRVYIYDETCALRPGEGVEFIGESWAAQSRRNPGGFDFAAWLWTRGIGMCATADAETIAIRPAHLFSPLALAGRVREGMGAAIDRYFGGQSALVRALVLGDKAELPDQLYDDFRNSGLAHLLAVSGLHIGCLALALERFLRALRRTRLQAFIITAALLFLYAGLIGFPSSVVRAGIMFLALRGAPLSARPADTITSLSLALIIVLFRPLMIADTGFQLSFAAVGSLLLLSEPIGHLLEQNAIAGRKTRGWRGWARRVAAHGVQLFCASIAVTLGTLPIVAASFGRISLLSPITNLAAIPLCTLALPMVFIKLAILSVFPALNGSVFAIPDALLAVLKWIAEGMAGVRFGMINLPGWPWYLSAIYAALCVAASPYSRTAARRRRLIVLLLPAVALASLFIAWAGLPGGLAITFLDAGQGDAIVLRAEGETYLVDTGNPGGPADAYLAWTGQWPRAVFLTHPDTDHAGGFSELVERMCPERIYLPEGWDGVEADAEITRALDRARQMGAQVVYLSGGDSVELSENVRADVLQPLSGASTGDSNALSLVLRVSYGGGSALLMGDMPESAELDGYPVSNLVKAAHHGAGSANSARMLRSASPSVLVISVGRNSYGHPAQRVLDEARSLGARVFRTDECGAIEARVGRDGTIEIETFLDAEG